MEHRLPTILLIDDDRDIRDVAHALLECLGYSVIDAAHAAAALDIAAGSATIDLVFTDVQMPGMNGFQLADAIHRLRPRVPVVYATGYAGTLTETSAHPPGPILAKPYRMAALRTIVEQSLAPA